MKKSLFIAFCCIVVFFEAVYAFQLFGSGISGGLGSELITNGNFSAWTSDDPDSWTVIGESGTDPEISEVGTGESHGGSGTGFCNMYTSGVIVEIRQTVSITATNTYRLSINVDTLTTDKYYIKLGGDLCAAATPTETGTKIADCVAGSSNSYLEIIRNSGSGVDVTFDDVSLKEVL